MREVEIRHGLREVEVQIKAKESELASLRNEQYRLLDRLRWEMESKVESIEGLDLEVPVYNILRKAGFETVGDVVRMFRIQSEFFDTMPQMGEKRRQQLFQKLIEKGYIPDAS